MRPIDADELMEHAMRDRLDSRELIWQMINNAPTIYKDKPMKPELNWESLYAMCAKCKQPITELIVTSIGHAPHRQYNYCPWCGEKIDWNYRYAEKYDTRS